MGFVNNMRSQGHAVELICRVLREQGRRVAARTYRACKHTGRMGGSSRTAATSVSALWHPGDGARRCGARVPAQSGYCVADYLLFANRQAVGVFEAKKLGTSLIGVETQPGKYVTGLPDALTAPVRSGRCPSSTSPPAARPASRTVSTPSALVRGAPAPTPQDEEDP